MEPINTQSSKSETATPHADTTTTEIQSPTVQNSQNSVNIYNYNLSQAGQPDLNTPLDPNYQQISGLVRNQSFHAQIANPQIANPQISPQIIQNTQNSQVIQNVQNSQIGHTNQNCLMDLNNSIHFQQPIENYQLNQQTLYNPWYDTSIASPHIKTEIQPTPEFFANQITYQFGTNQSYPFIQNHDHFNQKNNPRESIKHEFINQNFLDFNDKRKKSRKSSGTSSKSAENNSGEPVQTYEWMKVRRVGANGNGAEKKKGKF